MSLTEKKIAIITERADTRLGGAEQSVLELTDALAAHGFHVNILAAKGQKNTENTHILCQNAPGKRTCLFTFARALKKHLAENHYDIIHSVLPFDFADVYQPRGGTYAESILRNAASYQNRFIERYKRITAFANIGRTVLLQAERKLCKNPAGPVVVALSGYVAEQFRRHYNILADRLKIICNGVKIDNQTNPAEIRRLRAQIIARLGLKKADGSIFFLFVANNFRLKGLRVCMKAMQLAAQSNTEKKGCLIIAGSGKTYKYRRMARKLNIHKRVVFLGPLRNIQNALSIADVAVLPTFYDPSSRFILEAIAAGKPVITTEFNGASDLFVNNRHGRVIDRPENTFALAEAISYFTNTGNIQKASGAIVEDNLKEKISIERVAEELILIYNSLPLCDTKQRLQK